MIRILILLSTALILLFLPLRPILAQTTSGDILFIDDFESGSLGSWIIESGRWSINNGQLLGFGAGRAQAGRINTGNTEWDNYILELDVNNNNGIDEGIGFRRTDNGNNSYEVIIRHGTGAYNTPQIILAKVQSGKYSVLYDTHDIPLANNVVYHFKFSVENEHLQAWINGTQIYDLVDTGTTVKKGPISLSYNTGDYGTDIVRFDNVKVTSIQPLPSSTPSPTPSEKTPLIFIPGIAGSELKINEDIPWVADDGHGGVYTHTYQKDEVIWLNGTQAALPGNDDYFDALRMLPNGKDSQAHITPTGKALSVYDPTINYLIEQGYVLGDDLFVYGYDWRKDLTETSNDFNLYLTAILQQKSTSKADIITHSMGGLVARKYIENPDSASKVNKLVTVAPPFLGSIESLKNLVYGGCLTRPQLENSLFCIGIPNSEVRDVYQNWISGYQLLPSKKYYDFYNGSTNYPVPIRDESDIDGNLITGDLNYDQTKQLLTNLGYNTPLYTPAETFHEIDDNLNNTNGVDTTVIVGSGKATLGQIIEKNKYDFFGNKTATKDEVVINGDATVPLFSASLNDPSRNISLFDPKKVFYTKDTHGGIITNPSVLDFAKSIFENNPTLPADISQTPTPLDGSLFSVHSPVLIHAYDIHGNHTGPLENGNYEVNIPGSSYETIDDTKFIFLPQGKYQFKFEATDQGSFDFKIRDFTDEKNTSSQVYKDISIQKESTGYIVVDQFENKNSPLNIDTDNDGTEDKQYQPTEYFDSPDTQAPKTEILITGQKGTNGWYKNDVQVSLKGIDETNGSGIAKVEYSLDKGITIQEYTEPFTISAEGLTNLRVKATDKAGNEEPLQSVDLKIDKTAPEAKIIFNLLTKEFDFIGIDNLGKTTKIDNGQTVTITDEAGNTTRLTLTSKNRPRRENVSLKTIQYNNQAAIKPDNNLLGIFYTLDRNKQINFLLQRAVIQGEERLYSLYNPFINKTEIVIKKPKMKMSKETIIGKTLLFFETNNGELNSSF